MLCQLIRAYFNCTYAKPAYILSSMRRRLTAKDVYIIATPRSGSTLLGMYLQSSRQVRWHSEVLCPKRPVFRMTAWLRWCPDLRSKLVAHLITRFYGYGPDAVNVAKLHFEQAEACGMPMAALVRHLATAKLLVLYRGSLLRQYLSLLIALKTQRWCRPAEEDPRHELDGRIVVPPQELLDYCALVRGWYEAFLRSEQVRQRAIIIRYEDLDAQPKRLFNETIFPFLGLKPMPISTPFGRQSLRPLDEVIANFSEVKDLLFHPLCLQEYGCGTSAELPSLSLQQSS